MDEPSCDSWGVILNRGINYTAHGLDSANRASLLAHRSTNSCGAWPATECRDICPYWPWLLSASLACCCIKPWTLIMPADSHYCRNLVHGLLAISRPAATRPFTASGPTAMVATTMVPTATAPFLVCICPMRSLTILIRSRSQVSLTPLI